MKVLLLSPNIESTPDPVFPLGLAYMAGALERIGVPYRVLDLCFAEDYEKEMEACIRDFEPDLIALSLRNLDNVSYPNYVSYLSFFRETVRIIRKYSQAKVLLGGSGFSLLPGEVLEYLEADLGIVGEGEKGIVRLINELSWENTQTSPGPLFMNDYGGITHDLDSLPLPERSGFDLASYLKWGGMANIQTKRGCPFRCIYCTYPVIEGRGVRLRSPALVCDEIEMLLDQGIDSLFIVDNTFNYPVEHAEAICREIIARGLKLDWSCYANPKFTTPRLIDLMVKAGCSGLEFGCDAANDMMLGKLCKDFTTEDLERASGLCRDGGMRFCHSLLLGGPGETMETVRQTADAVCRMSPTAVICMVGIRMFPHTRLAEIAKEEGVISPEADFREPLFYLSPAIKEEIHQFLEELSKEYKTWIFPGFDINNKVELQRKLRRFGRKGPLWEYMDLGKIFNNK